MIEQPEQSVVKQKAFTLVELLTAIAIIALVMTITLPGIIGLFTAGADLQARNVISGMFGAARAVAIENQSYAIVHVQLGTDGKCWAAVMKGGYEDHDSNPATPETVVFRPVAGFPPQQMPGDMAFGEISESYINAGGNYDVTVNDDLPGFTTFNIIFSPDGSLVTLVNGATPQLETDVKIFGGDDATDEQQIWNHPGSLPDAGPIIDEDGVRAITAFHYRTLEAMPGTGTGRQDWLEKNGQFLCVNPYTGKLLPTK